MAAACASVLKQAAPLDRAGGTGCTSSSTASHGKDSAPLITSAKDSLSATCCRRSGVTMAVLFDSAIHSEAVIGLVVP